MAIPPLQPAVKAADLSLERLASNPNISPQDKAAEVSRQFEALLLRQILNEAYKAPLASSGSQSSVAREIYQDIITSQLADNISKAGTFGLAQSFQHQLTQQVAGSPPVDPATSPVQKQSPDPSHERKP